MIREIMAEQNISMYRLAKSSGIPYTTVNDICSGRARLEKCSAETVYKLSKSLGVPMESLLAPCFEQRTDFELFKSNICHKVKELGDIDFILNMLSSDDIRTYFNKKWYRESFYVLAMTDYLSRVNNIPLCEDYNDIRRYRLDTVLYPAGIVLSCTAAKNNSAKEQALKDAIPEFLHFNIAESEVRNVV